MRYIEFFFLTNVHLYHWQLFFYVITTTKHLIFIVCFNLFLKRHFLLTASLKLMDVRSFRKSVRECINKVDSYCTN